MDVEARKRCAELEEENLAQQASIEALNKKVFQLSTGVGATAVAAAAASAPSAAAVGSAPPPASAPSSEPSASAKISDDPQYAKFFKMLKMRVPRGAVENKMRAARKHLIPRTASAALWSHT